LLYQFLMTKLY